MITLSNPSFNFDEPTAVTLGNFDGFHQGHRTLINEIKTSPYKTVIFTFSPHPVSFFSKDNSFKTLYTEDEKRQIAETLGVDFYIPYPFTKDFAALSPQEFIRLLKAKTNCRLLVIGADYSFGKNKSGSAKDLKSLGENMGIEVKILPKIQYIGEDISSTKIRSCLKDGDVKTAAVLLSSPYFIASRVEKGFHRGTGMGFPTANQVIPEGKFLPKDGVYKTTALIDGKPFPSLTNIGKNPTFHNTSRTVETYILDENKMLYGRSLKIEFNDFIRNEIKFPDKAALQAQIQRDIEAAQRNY